MKNIHAISLVKMALGAAVLAVATLSTQADQFDFYKLGHNNATDFKPDGTLNTLGGYWNSTGGDLTSSDVDLSIFNGNLRYTVGSLTATATATYNNAIAAVVQDHESGWNTANGIGAGLGVYHKLDNSDDNITTGETLTISFNHVVNLTSIGLSTDGHHFGGWTQGETFLLDGVSTSLAHPITLNKTGSIFTFAFGGTNHPTSAQFYLASMTVSRVPEGGLTLALLGGALAGLVLLRRRFVRYGFPSAFFALSAFYLLIQNYFTHHPADDAARGPIAWRLEKL